MPITKIMKLGMVAAMAALTVFSLGVPALATTGEDGPTPPRLGDPGSTPFPEVQVVSVYLTTGLWVLGTPVCDTPGLAWNATATAVDSAIEVCLGADAVRVTKPTSANVFKVVFDAPTGDVAEMTAWWAAYPAAPGVTVSTVQNGNNTGWAQPDGLAGGGTVNVTTTVAPHGGYSSGTDFCLQCHSVHDGNEFALLREVSVTATCQTCHSLFGAAATGAVDSNFLTGENTRLMGSAASRSAYDLGDGGLIGGDAIVRGHQLGGIGGGTAGDYSLSDGAVTLYALDSPRWNAETLLSTLDSTEVSGATQDGIYCGSCHTPHGDIGQLVNNWKMTDPVAVGTATWTTGSPKITITFTNPAYTTAGFTSAQRKATLRLETDTVANNDTYTRVFNEFSTRSGPTDFNLGYSGVWTVADCPRSPSVSGGVQSICITDLPAYPGTPVDVYLGDEGRPAGSNRVDYDGETPDTGWRACTSGNGAPVLGTGYNTACGWATTTDAEGQLVSLYGYKMLSSGPNHQMAPRSVQAYAGSSTETNAWCGTCHPTRWDFDGLHPTHSAGGGCTACHGNPADGASYDYPHTSSVSRLLKMLPDGLCLTCHSFLP